MAANRAYLIAGGILLVGGAAGIAYYIYVIRQPKSAIDYIRIRPVGGDNVVVAAMVRNVGRANGYFKIQALIVPTDCPYQGSEGYPPTGGANWMNIANWIASQGKGVWAGFEPDQGFQPIAPGQSAELTTPPVPLPKGTYNIYVNAAVSKSGKSKDRLLNREYYKWVTGYSV